MIEKNEFPILEYDDLSREVIEPNHGSEDLRLPGKCVFAFLGDCVERFAKEKNAVTAGEFINVSKSTPIYVFEENGEKICLVQPTVGAPAATQLLDHLISCGCRTIIATGSCGVLADIEENAFLIPTRALRAEGTSYHYLAASRYIDMDEDMIDAIADTFSRSNIPFEKCITWTTDGYFRETRDMVEYRVAEGCTVVEMECAALASCARKRGARFGEFLFTADSLAAVTDYDARNFGCDSHAKALMLAVNVIGNIRL